MIIGTYYSASSLAVVLVRSDGLVWDWKASTFAPLPDGGVPSATQSRAMNRPVTAGPLSGNFFLDMPGGFDPLGTWCAFFTLSGTALGTQVDLWPVQQAVQIAGLMGGGSGAP